MLDDFRVPPVDEKLSMWLKGVDDKQRNLDDWKAKPIEMEEKVWIKKDSSERLPESTTPFIASSSWDKVMDYHSQVDGDKWILQDPSEKTDEMKEDNPWIFKSSCAILNAPTSNDKIGEIDQWIYTKIDDVIDILQ